MKPGTVEELKILRFRDFGAYLGEEGAHDAVLLPKKEVPEDASVGDTVRVFIYLDSEDRPIATTREPRIVLGGTAVLKIREVSQIGGFLDWGLEKDLFLPYHEMAGHPKAGEEVLVRLYTDRSGRLCASMRDLWNLLSTDSPYGRGDEVTGRIYEFGHSDNFGTFVAVDDRYSGMLPPTEDMRGHRIGEVLHLTVTGVKPDGKLDLSTRQTREKQIPADAEKVLSVIDSYAGVLPFTEKASPEVIFRETGLSKAAFKRAVGHLYRERLITLTDGKIRRAED